MPLVNPTASRTSRSPISADTFYLIPLWTLLCFQEWIKHMTKMMKTLPLHECMMKTLLLQECLYPTLPSSQMQMMTQMQNPITSCLTPMRLTTIQAKHLYTAPEATYPFTVPLVNHHNIVWMRKTIFPKIKPSWMT